MSLDLPPLLGKDGIYRVAIHGNSGTGKTTLSNKLAEILQVPVIHLDEVHWRPGWVEASDEEMIKDLTLLIDKAAHIGSGWIIDGNYERPTKRIMDFVATDIICLLKC
jgi:adenylate kinase family enzyme